MARHYNFEAIENFRELGGYETPFGDTAYGVIYRSGGLSEATDNDLKKIQSLGIKSVLDFRTEQTKIDYPDKTLEDPSIRHYMISVNGGGRVPTGFDDMLASYFEMLADPQNAKEILEIIANCEKPLVIHCTAGKDRTGIYTMLLLWANGVSFNDIAADYLLTFPLVPNLYAKAVAGDKKYDVCVLEPNSHFVPKFIEEFQKKYGTPQNYFKQVGLSEATIAVLCNILHKQEKSCGAVVRCGEKILIEHMAGGHYSIPKGHVEPWDKGEKDTALREIKEETGLDVTIDGDDSYYIYYSPFEGCVKKVVFFRATAKSMVVTAQECEVHDILWLSEKEAMEILTHDSDKDVMRWALRIK